MNIRNIWIEFIPSLSTRVALIDVAHRAKISSSLTQRALRKVSHVTPHVFFKYFESQIQPVLLCGAEVWGVSDSEEIEIVHLQAII